MFIYIKKVLLTVGAIPKAFRALITAIRKIALIVLTLKNSFESRGKKVLVFY